MFESKLTPAAAAQAAETGAMRAFEWHELVARLAAARDLRGVFAGSRVDSRASFAAGAARALAPGGSDDWGDKGYVNPDALGAGKSPCANTVAAGRGAGQCDREMR